MAKVIIIGAGISGLSCALKLQKHGHEVQIYEKSDEVGGRISTNRYNNQLLDIGFQIFLTSYKKTLELLDHKKIKFNYFKSGAKILNDDINTSSSTEIYNPILHPSQLLKTLNSPIINLKDKYLLLKLFLKLLFLPNKIKNSECLLTTKDFLINYGFSNKFLNGFLFPFFSGVLLDRELKQDSSFFLYILKKFIFGKAVLPKNGMQQIPQNIAEQLTPETIKFNSTITKIGKQQIEINNELKVSADYIVLTTDENLNQILDISTTLNKTYNSSCTLYYLSSKPVLEEKILYLNTCKNALISTIVDLTSISQNYSKTSERLISVAIPDPDTDDLTTLIELADKELEKLFATTFSEWKFLKGFFIKNSLPINIEKKQLEALKKELQDSNIFLAGDWCNHPSIEGAVESGLEVAEKVLKIC